MFTPYGGNEEDQRIKGLSEFNMILPTYRVYKQPSRRRDILI